MAILMWGLTECPLCNDVIATGEAVVAFPALGIDASDPLFCLDDAAVHQRCLLERVEILDLVRKDQRFRKYLLDHYPNLNQGSLPV